MWKSGEESDYISKYTNYFELGITVIVTNIIF